MLNFSFPGRGGGTERGSVIQRLAVPAILVSVRSLRYM